MNVSQQHFTTADMSIYEQYSQRTYNVTMRRVHATIVAVGKQWILCKLCVYL